MVTSEDQRDDNKRARRALLKWLLVGCDIALEQLDPRDDRGLADLARRIRRQLWNAVYRLTC